jgi:hypothetical protein
MGQVADDKDIAFIVHTEAAGVDKHGLAFAVLGTVDYLNKFAVFIEYL